jgi:hypothetical protein
MVSDGGMINGYGSYGCDELALDAEVLDGPCLRMKASQQSSIALRTAAIAKRCTIKLTM